MLYDFRNIKRIEIISRLSFLYSCLVVKDHFNFKSMFMYIKPKEHFFYAKKEVEL